jgi:site-specific DNA-methyltransferase (adenine-specific)
MKNNHSESYTNRITTGDCLEELPKLPESCTQLIIADPPYNLDKDFGLWKEAERRETWLPWCKQWLAECKRVLVPNGNIFVYGIHHHMCWIQCELYELGLQYRRQIIWNYDNGFAGSKGKTWAPNPEGRLAGDIWNFPTLAGRRFRDEKVDHPTQKPLSLTLRIVEHFSNPGDLVVIPFAGSGTECLAAAMLNRDFWGIELNPKYVQIAQDRLEKWYKSAKQLQLPRKDQIR